MAETDSKRGKIDELLQYIATRLEELEEEKEELKEFQEKDKERRCLEYAVYSRELEEVTETLEEIEEERRAEVHSSNVRREQYNDREKQAQVSTTRLFEIKALTSRVDSGADYLKDEKRAHNAEFDATGYSVRTD